MRYRSKGCPMSYRLMPSLSRTERICFDLAFYILTIAANVLVLLTLGPRRQFVADSVIAVIVAGLAFQVILYLWGRACGRTLVSMSESRAERARIHRDSYLLKATFGFWSWFLMFGPNSDDWLWRTLAGVIGTVIMWVFLPGGRSKKRDNSGPASCRCRGLI
jgi:hypothetical protein